MEIKAQIKELCCGEQKLRARANLMLDNSFIIKDIRVVEGKGGLFIAFPARRMDDRFVDICYPINNDLREEIKGEILAQYNKTLKKQTEKKNV